jgi:hypothetical protein
MAGAYYLATHAKLFHHSMRAHVAYVRRGPNANELVLTCCPCHGGTPGLDSNASTPPRASDGVPDHRRPRSCIYLEVDRADQPALEDYGKGWESVSGLGHIRRNERLCVAAREGLRDVRQEARELGIVAIRERVVDVLGAEWSKYEALGRDRRR